jgi:hypothetical protein
LQHLLCLSQAFVGSTYFEMGGPFLQQAQVTCRKRAKNGRVLLIKAANMQKASACFRASPCFHPLY